MYNPTPEAIFGSQGSWDEKTHIKHTVLYIDAKQTLQMVYIYIVVSMNVPYNHDPSHLKHKGRIAVSPTTSTKTPKTLCTQ